MWSWKSSFLREIVLRKEGKRITAPLSRTLTGTTQCDEEGRLCAFALTPASVDERKLLTPLTQWMTTGIVVGDRGYISEAKAQELGARGIYLIAAIRKNMRKLATHCQLACLQARHRIEEVFAFLKCAFGLVRTTHRACYALPIHLLVCLLAYSLYKQLIA